MCALLYDLAGFHNLGCPHDDMCSRRYTLEAKVQKRKTAQQCTNASRRAMIRFAFMIVDSRWAMAITVRPFISDSSAFCTWWAVGIAWA